MKRLLIGSCLAVSMFCLAQSRAQTPPQNATTVIWLSIDGFRHDYMDRFQPPELTKLAAEGAYTRQEKPIFPSLTFPNHIAQVTGTTVDHSGIVMNGWYDTKLHEQFSFPDHPEFIRSEPIWQTAEKQSVPTAVVDWPMSTSEAGTIKADFFDAGFDSKESDDHRLHRVMQMLKTHELPPSIDDRSTTQPTSHFTATPRLIISYLSNVDHFGHQDGPESPGIRDAVLETDGVIKTFVDSAVDWFKSSHAADDQLYIILSTDHGMESTRVQVNLDRLIGADLMQDVKIVTSGPMACVYFLKVPEDQKPARLKAITDKLATVSYLKAWPSDQLPAQYHFADHDRAGDVTVMLDGGYTFTSNREATTRPIGERGPLGMHGYDPNSSPDLLGSAIIWRLRNPIGGKDLGPMDNTQWHATVCKLLGIEPAEHADLRAVAIP